MHDPYLMTEDLTGRTFGKLIVTGLGEDYIPPNGRYKVKRLMCSCSCGNTTEVRVYELLRGITSSCGCLARERASEANRLPKGVASLNSLYDNYKRRARRIGIAFNLSLERFREMTQQLCHYCGKEPSGVVARKGTNGEYIYNGIDRQDNKVGYEDGNVVPCCKQCNMMKGTQTVEEFLEGVSRISRRLLL